eukprot:scaffold14501_cov163-Amphora_coffeaeformis.AAC.1
MTTANLKDYIRELPRAQHPVTIQSVKSAPGATNHSYCDYSKLPPPPGYTFPSNLDNMTFAEKVYDMLSKPRYEHSIAWMPHGRAFKIMVPKSFEAEVCPQYFGHSRYSSFLRDLNKYGFKHLTKGEDRNCKFSHCYCCCCCCCWRTPMKVTTILPPYSLSGPNEKTMIRSHSSTLLVDIINGHYFIRILESLTVSF